MLLESGFISSEEDIVIEIPGRRFVQIADDVKFGKNVVIYEFVNLYGCEIGDDTQIGTFVEIQKDAVVGKRVRIQSHTFICSGVKIEDDVFIGHQVTFINDRYPRARKAREGTWTCEGITVRKGASIGSGATILCGVTIGEEAVIGAGSVVTHNVDPKTTVAGNPAQPIRQKWQPNLQRNAPQSL